MYSLANSMQACAHTGMIACGEICTCPHKQKSMHALTSKGLTCCDMLICVVCADHAHCPKEGLAIIFNTSYDQGVPEWVHPVIGATLFSDAEASLFRIAHKHPAAAAGGR